MGIYFLIYIVLCTGLFVGALLHEYYTGWSDITVADVLNMMLISFIPIINIMIILMLLSELSSKIGFILNKKVICRRKKEEVICVI